MLSSWGGRTLTPASSVSNAKAVTRLNTRRAANVARHGHLPFAGSVSLFFPFACLFLTLSRSSLPPSALPASGLELNAAVFDLHAKLHLLAVELLLELCRLPTHEFSEYAAVER